MCVCVCEGLFSDLEERWYFEGDDDDYDDDPYLIAQYEKMTETTGI